MARVAYHLSHELGTPEAQVARYVEVCTSAILEATQNLESAEDMKVFNNVTSLAAIRRKRWET